MQSGIKCTQLNGSMSIQARDQTIEKFSNDLDCKVFPLLSLISENSDFDHLFMIWVLTFICLVDFPDDLKAVGVALNLIVASHVRTFPIWYCIFLLYV